MKALQGSSGIFHHFAEVVRGSKGTRVVETCSAEVSEMDVIRFYAKIFDVGASSAVLVAPSYTPEARELARGYGISLRNSEGPEAKP